MSKAKEWLCLLSKSLQLMINGWTPLVLFFILPLG